MIRVPKLSKRKDSGRLYCTDPRTKKQVYFASQLQYENWRAEFIASEEARRTPLEVHPSLAPPPSARLTVEQFTQAYMDHARIWYRKDGKPTSQVRIYRTLTRHMNAVLGERRINTLRPRDIEAVLDHMVNAGVTRRVINDWLTRIRTMLKWGVKQEYVSGEVLGRILTVRGLPIGRTRAREKPRVGPVDEGRYRAVLEKLRPMPRACVELQWLSGMRPGEVVRIRPAEIDRGRDPWEYRPGTYKTEHRHEDTPEKRRVIFLGRRCQAILEPWLKNAVADEPVFKTNRGGEYTTSDLWFAVKRACRRAGVPPWAPNALRHAAATAVRQRFNAEAARVYLGHENLRTTELYAERDADLARRVAMEMG